MNAEELQYWIIRICFGSILLMVIWFMMEWAK